MLDLRLLEGKRLKLVANALGLALLGLDAADGNTLGRKALEDALLLAWEHKEETVTLRIVPGGTAYTMDVRVDILGDVELDDPVDCRKVETSSSNIGSKQDGVLRAGKLAKDLESLGLLLLAVEGHEANTGTQLAESLVNELDLTAGTHEHECLAFCVCADERIEQIELLVELDKHVVLL